MSKKSADLPPLQPQSRATAAVSPSFFDSAVEIPGLQDITYGVEVEKYNLRFTFDSAKQHFITNYRTALEAEQKQQLLERVGIRTESPTTASLCVIKKEGRPIMVVRLDGECEFIVQQDAVLQERQNQVLVNVEFISVDAGIKKHAEFMQECAKGQRSEVTRSVASVSSAVSQKAPAVVNASDWLGSAASGGRPQDTHAQAAA